MENILNLSFFGSALLVLTTLRLTWLIGITENAEKVQAVFGAFGQKLEDWLQSAYKPLTVLLLSGLVLSLCYTATADKYLHIGQAALIAGLISTGLGITFTTLSADIQRMLQISFGNQTPFSVPLSAGKAFVNIRNLIFCLLSLLLVLLTYQPGFQWGLYPTLSLLSGFALGSSTALLMAYLYRGKSAKPSHPKILKADRMDAFAAAITAGMLLGASLSEMNVTRISAWVSGPVILPLVLALSGVMVSAVSVFLLNLKQKSLETGLGFAVKLTNALLLILVAYVVLRFLLPETWMIWGREYKMVHVFYAVQTGIIASLLFHEMAGLYSYCRLKYHAYNARIPAGEHFIFTSMRTVFRSICVIVPLVIAAWLSWEAYQFVGLYGLVLTTVAMLSNMTTHFSFDIFKQE